MDDFRNRLASTVTVCRQTVMGDTVHLYIHPWALAIHTVTACVYRGMPGGRFGVTAIISYRI